MHNDWLKIIMWTKTSNQRALFQFNWKKYLADYFYKKILNTERDNNLRN